MATKVLKTKFWEFSQNNSGGSFDVDDSRGIGPRVWIEAVDKDHAISRAIGIGIYFDGVDNGIDCQCCGDRWYQPWDKDGQEQVSPNEEFDFNWNDTVYIHHIDGTIERIKKGS